MRVPTASGRSFSTGLWCALDFFSLLLYTGDMNPSNLIDEIDRRYGNLEDRSDLLAQALVWCIIIVLFMLAVGLITLLVLLTVVTHGMILLLLPVIPIVLIVVLWRMGGRDA